MDIVNVPVKFEVRSFTRSWDASGVATPGPGRSYALPPKVQDLALGPACDIVMKFLRLQLTTFCPYVIIIYYLLSRHSFIYSLIQSFPSCPIRTFWNKYSEVNSLCSNTLYCILREASMWKVTAVSCRAKRDIAISCRLSVCLSVCLSVTLVDCEHIGWKMETLETNCTDN